MQAVSHGAPYAGHPSEQREELPRGAAAVISLAAVREQKQWAKFRQQLHERVEHWLDTLEEQMKEPKPPLEQITRAVWGLRQELTGSRTEALVEHR